MVAPRLTTGRSTHSSYRNASARSVVPSPRAMYVPVPFKTFCLFLTCILGRTSGRDPHKAHLPAGRKLHIFKSILRLPQSVL